jgi:hypothetical protein
MLGADPHAAGAVVDDATQREAVVAGRRIAVAVDIEEIPALLIHGRVQHAPKERIDGTELGPWLRTIGIGHDDAGRRAVQAPAAAPVDGAVEHVVDILGPGRSRRDAALKQTVHDTPARVIRQAMARIDKPRGKAGALVNDELRGIGALRDRHPHVRRSAKVVIGDVDVVLLTVDGVAVHQQPRLIRSVLPHLVGSLRHIPRSEPEPVGGVSGVRGRATVHIRLAR